MGLREELEWPIFMLQRVTKAYLALIFTKFGVLIDLNNNMSIPTWQSHKLFFWFTISHEVIMPCNLKKVNLLYYSLRAHFKTTQDDNKLESKAPSTYQRSPHLWKRCNQVTAYTSLPTLLMINMAVSLRGRCGTSPVSYTHLDVYKRQILFCFPGP